MQLSIREIGPFKDLTIDFPEKTDPNKAEIHAFVGENGTGKTTILAALANQISGGWDKTLHSRAWDNTFFFNGKGIDVPKINSSSSSIRVYFFNQDRSQMKKDLFAEYRHTTIDNAGTYLQNKNYPCELAAFAYSGYRKTISTQIKAIEDNKGHPLRNTLSFDHVGKTDSILQI